MSDPRPNPTQVEPWPKWVRLPLIGALVAVVLYGVIASFHSGFSSAALRVVIAAVVIPALLAPIQLWGLRRRNANLPGTVVHHTRTLIEGLDAEANLAVQERTTGATDESLGEVSIKAAQALKMLQQGSRGEAAGLLGELPSATTSWNRTSQLRRQVAEGAKLAQRLAKRSS